MARKGNQVTTGKIRMSYVVLDKPRAVVEGQEPKFSMSILIPKTDKKTLGEIKAVLEEVKQAAVKDKWGGKMPSNLRTPLKDGDEERPDDAVYAGHYFINATAKTRPLVLDYDKQEVMDLSEVYSGCYGKAVINFYAYAAPGNKGIACGLLGVQKLYDGEPLGGGRITASAFDDDDEDDFLD
ncbi:DUF2815 family protein [Zhenhengia yiwuensis]|uniref:DUF2815 family protein n=1 Tax=Zhenhengia yiwuensis TaxID=2763666 RepID=A0A926ELD5_9FIRM|nr:DUF2815 family protein [Zhenhengia yiwuensis]MBC8580173.1 DUF2815 family protein [Zhenhengia yiwuensis]